MATPVKKTTSVVRIKKGQRIILPADAKIISITEIDGAKAESLCDLPDPTPLKEYTFFFEKRADSTGTEIFIYHFVLGETKVNMPGGIKQDDGLQPGTGPYADSFTAALKAVPGIGALYICTDGCGGTGCNNTITMMVPETLPEPYFIMSVNGTAADDWFVRVYPIDPDQPNQVERAACTNRV